LDKLPKGEEKKREESRERIGSKVEREKAREEIVARGREEG
jgi:hypothetical protein